MSISAIGGPASGGYYLPSTANMILDLLLSNPLIAIAWIVALISSLTFHEFAHALVGKWRGDDTAEQMGRLTLNPLAHLDLVGTLLLLTVGFGWAKPVPFDPQKLKHPIQDGVVIALAGPAANLFLAVLAAGAFRALAVSGSLDFNSALPMFLVLMVFVNLMLLFFNLVPIPPLDGSKVLDAVFYGANMPKARMFLNVYGPKILLGLVILSLLTSINVFFFVSTPALFACEQMLGGACLQVLSGI